MQRGRNRSKNNTHLIRYVSDGLTYSLELWIGRTNAKLDLHRNNINIEFSIGKRIKTLNAEYQKGWILMAVTNQSSCCDWIDRIQRVVNVLLTLKLHAMSYHRTIPLKRLLLARTKTHPEANITEHMTQMCGTYGFSHLKIHKTKIYHPKMFHIVTEICCRNHLTNSYLVQTIKIEVNQWNAPNACVARAFPSNQCSPDIYIQVNLPFGKYI